MNGKGESRIGKGRVRAATVAAALMIVVGAGFLAAATFISNPQTVESHGHAGTIASTVTMGTTSIAYATPGLSGYASCTEATYPPAPTTDIQVNFTNVAPGDNCTWTATLTDVGSLPGLLNASLGPSTMHLCTTVGQINCYWVGQSIGAGATVTAGGTYLWSGWIEYAPGSTVQGVLGEAIWNAYEQIGT